MAQRFQTAALLSRLAKPGRCASLSRTYVTGVQYGGHGWARRPRLRTATAIAEADPGSGLGLRDLSTTAKTSRDSDGGQDAASDMPEDGDQEHAIISAFDLFSVGIGPSSSHTVGPMRAGNIFVTDLVEAGLLHKVHRIRISIYGSLALTGEGHMTPSALLLGLEGADIESVDTAYVPKRYVEIKESKKLRLGGGSSEAREIDFDYGRDFVWEWSRKLPTHSNGMRFRVFDESGDMIATNDLFSVGGGFVINGRMATASSGILPEIEPAAEGANGESQIDRAEEPNSSEAKPAALSENLYYKEIKRSDAAEERRSGLDYDSYRAATSDQVQQPMLPEKMSENLEVDQQGPPSSETRHTPYPFRTGNDLLAICKKHNLTIAQVMFENEKGLGLQEHEIFDKLFHLWDVMDNCIREGVQAPSHAALPGSLKLRRRAPALYQQLTRGLYPEHAQVQPAATWPQLQKPASSAAQDALAIEGKEAAVSQAPVSGRGLSKQRRRAPPRMHGSPHHPISVSPPRSATLAAMDYLTVYAIAVNETNAAGGRVVTAPTNGAAGIIPAVLKYVVEFVSDDPERDIPIFLLTAAAIASLFKRGATISAAEGGCMAEVGVACSMAAGAYAACMGAGPETIEQAAEIGIEHNLGLTCDPIAGLVQAPCIERNALGAIKAVSSANLALNSVAGLQKVSLDDAIGAMRLTAKGMKDEFKETSLSGLATSVPYNIPVSVPDC
ncbi:L-serine ammonia-lyase [Cyphellophora europaea CBS 101466]|uniref:L-serine ammonia-lyase n=1 Tax=Cyphellophora europaea (strain CBS 101466) TaxID=1220924 RepID=W2S085_CYPE1|nr:L-serine ammonia-lyase [Cyphellophora europaea CBS 101466]ETN41354.1 L-serine ammonia-lyase [Cyphellophora europaea CBS 101466]